MKIRFEGEIDMVEYDGERNDAVTELFKLLGLKFVMGAGRLGRGEVEVEERIGEQGRTKQAVRLVMVRQDRRQD